MNTNNTPYSPEPHPGMARYPYPKLKRPQRGRVVAGVCAGLAEQLRVDVQIVRLVVAALALFSGAGALAYVALWMFVPASDSEAPESKYSVPRPVNQFLAVIAVVASVGGASIFTGLSAALVVPLVVVIVGAVLAWIAYDRDTEQAVSLAGIGSIVLGALLVIAGVVLTVWRWNGAEDFLPALLAVFLTLLGLGALVVPLILRLWTSLAQQKVDKAEAQQRTLIATRLHDSVLQTLALIQKKADDQQEVMRLARSQERELRAWLFEPGAAQSSTVFGALETACGDVENLCDLRISLVKVGDDVQLGDKEELAVAAAREAMVNAGKHADVPTIDVYAECVGGQLSIFVRDRGAGFDVSQVPADRHGIRDSIVARMQQAGGQAEVNSQVGEGTEVELSLPVQGA